MNITISPAGAGLAAIFACSLVMSFGKSALARKCYIALSAVLSAVGVIGIATTRRQFMASLNKSAGLRHFDSDFVAWAVSKFDYYAGISIAITCLSLMALLLLLFANRRNRNGFIWRNSSLIAILLMLAVFFAGAGYCFRTINKIYDMAYFILLLAISEVLALYIPITVKRIATFKG